MLSTNVSDRPRHRRPIVGSKSLAPVHYDIRGPILDEAHRMAANGENVLKLNIGNPALYGFDASPDVLDDIARHLRDAEGYCESLGLTEAREAIRNHALDQGVAGVEIEHIFTGNGVSELIAMSLQGLLDVGDEILVPMPDYPLWTAAANLTGAAPVHYRCDELEGWSPDIEHMRSQITPKTRAIVVINPNNPTGAVYTREMLGKIIDLAREHDLVILSDEIYDTILYDDAVHHPIAAMAEDMLFITFNGLSKSHRSAGFRSGWMTVSGATDRASEYLSALTLLASMRLCANVPAQYAIRGALERRHSIDDFTAPGGRLHEQRRTVWEGLNSIDGVSCSKPDGGLYVFPKLDVRRFGITDDRRFILDFLRAEHVLMVQGTGFNWTEPDHFRIVFLAEVSDLEDAVHRLDRFLATYRQS